jgi:hypothetical protein
VSIVGLWKITSVPKDNPGIPNGTVLDSGYATWPQGLGRRANYPKNKSTLFRRPRDGSS